MSIYEIEDMSVISDIIPSIAEVLKKNNYKCVINKSNTEIIIEALDKEEIYSLITSQINIDKKLFKSICNMYSIGNTIWIRKKIK